MLKRQEQLSFEQASFEQLERSAWTKDRGQRRPSVSKTKRPRIALILLPLLAVLGLSTMAYLYALTNAEINVFGIGKTSVEIEERFTGWDTKQVQLAMGTGSDYVPGVARALIVPYITDANGNYIACDLADFSLPIDNKMDLGDVILEFASDWATNWTYGDDGYFYYNHVLYPTTANGANKTSVLLTKVSLSEAALEKYGEDAQINIEVLADILQAEGNAPSEWGLSADMTTGTVVKL